MKQINLKAISVLVLAGSSFAMYAAEPIEVPWNKVCQVSQARELFITNADGSTVQGYCVSIDVNEIALRTSDNRVVKVARKALSRIEMHRSPGHQFSSLSSGVHKELKEGFQLMFSPWAPAGLVLVPGTLAWGAIAAPFCLIGDLKAKVNGTQVIKPL